VEKGVSIRNAALQCGVNASALHRVVTGKNEMDAARGRKTTIPKLVEDCLANMLTQLIDSHHYMDTCNLPIVAKEICVKLGIKTTNWIGGRKWVSNFFKRHPLLSSRVAGKISRARGIHFNLLSHAEWYAAVKEFIHLYNPFNPSKSLPKTAYSTSVLHPTLAALTLAKQAGTAAGKLIAADVQHTCADSLAGHVSGASMAFFPLSQKGIAEREKLAGKKKKNPLPLDEAERAKYFVSTHSYTSESFAKLQGLKIKAVEDAAAAVAAKKVAGVELAQRKAAKEVKRKFLVKRGDKRVLNLKRWFRFIKDLLKYDGKLGSKVDKVVAAPAVPVQPNDSSKKRKAEEPVTFGPSKKQRI